MKFFIKFKVLINNDIYNNHAFNFEKTYQIR